MIPYECTAQPCKLTTSHRNQVGSMPGELTFILWPIYQPGSSFAIADWQVLPSSAAINFLLRREDVFASVVR